MGKKSGTVGHMSESLETIYWVKILKFFDTDPGSGMEKFGSGFRNGKNSDRQHWPQGAQKIKKH